MQSKTVSLIRERVAYKTPSNAFRPHMVIDVGNQLFQNNRTIKTIHKGELDNY